MSMVGKNNSAVAVEGTVAHRVYKQFVRTLSSRTFGNGEVKSEDVDFELQMYEETGWKLLEAEPFSTIKMDDGRVLPVVLYVMYKEVPAEV